MLLLCTEMAAVIKQPNRRFWYAFWRDAAGRQHLKSTKLEHTPAAPTAKERAAKAAENRRLAKELAERMEEAERGSGIEAHLRKLVADISERVSPRKLEFKTAAVYLRAWLDTKRASTGTLTRYRGTVEAFLAHLGDKANRPLADVTPEDVEAFFTARTKEGRKASTLKPDIAALNQIFRGAVNKGHLLSNPVAAASLDKEEGETKAPFTLEEIRALLTEAKGTEWATVILLGAYAGLRLRDAAGLTWANVDTVAGEIRLRQGKGKRKKKKADIVIPIHTALAAHLEALPAGDNPNAFLAPKLARTGGGGKSGLSEQFKRLMRRAGIEVERIEAEGGEGRAFHSKSFHSTRHFYVTEMEKTDIPDSVRKKLSGHRSDSAHARYSHAAGDTLRRAIAKLPTP